MLKPGPMPVVLAGGYAYTMDEWMDRPPVAETPGSTVVGRASKPS